MKVKINDLNPNPYKKEINKGKLNKEQVNKIKSNIKELGLMGSLPIFKKEGKYYLIAGHHRTQALKEIYGSNYEVAVTLHNYTDEQVLRGMVIENLTQRSGEFREELSNVLCVRKFLLACSTVEQAKRKDVKGIQDPGSVRDIYSWLNKKGEVISIGKISELLKINDTLDGDLIKKINKSKDGSKIN